MTCTKQSTFLVVMGVCGSGKTSVAEALHDKLHWPIAEADDFHPESNKIKMMEGTPLTDKDRHQWLLSLHDVIIRWQNESKSGLVTCSALKKSYRDILTRGENATNVHYNVHFIYLRGSKELLQTRMTSRKGHFMPQSLLQSQLDTLEEPSGDEKHVIVDIEKPLDAIVDDIMIYLASL